MKVFDLGEGKVLIAKEKGELHAIGHKCSHYGAPLINGATLLHLVSGNDKHSIMFNSSFR